MAGADGVRRVPTRSSQPLRSTCTRKRGREGARGREGGRKRGSERQEGREEERKRGSERQGGREEERKRGRERELHFFLRYHHHRHHLPSYRPTPPFPQRPPFPPFPSFPHLTSTLSISTEPLRASLLGSVCCRSRRYDHLDSKDARKDARDEGEETGGKKEEGVHGPFIYGAGGVMDC